MHWVDITSIDARMYSTSLKNTFTRLTDKKRENQSFTVTMPLSRTQ